MNTPPDCEGVLELAARLALSARGEHRPLDPAKAIDGHAGQLHKPLGCHPRDPQEVIAELDRLARPGLVGSTQPGFLSWVIGGSHPAGVAADWLAVSWGQNATMYDSSPAAADAEAASAAWLLDVLDLPRESSVGFTTGATMACFTALAAARLSVLERAGHDFERQGLFGCPEVAVYVCEDGHVTNFSALRYLGFGDQQIRRIPANAEGTFDCDALELAVREDDVAARIVIAQAGQIMSGAFDDFPRIAALCRELGAWLHVDGAFGLWVRASRRLRIEAHGVELADSWSVDGHKWLQLPYDCGFAIVRDEQCHRRAMSMRAGYLFESEAARDNSDYVPELSRRARGFAVWAVMQTMGRFGIERMVERHCNAAHFLGRSLRALPGVDVVNKVCLNQLAVTFEANGRDCSADLADALNATGRYFVRTASWREQQVVRFSIINDAVGCDEIKLLVADIARTWAALSRKAA